jgi:UbiD family decarboxylase
MGKEAGTMSFVDMREWIARLDKEGELRRITAEVSWDRELGAIARRVLEKKGPALLFERIKGYETGRCTKVFVSGLGSVGRSRSGTTSKVDATSTRSRAS